MRLLRRLYSSLECTLEYMSGGLSGIHDVILGVAVLGLNRPHAKNALSAKMVEDMRTHLAVLRGEHK